MVSACAPPTAARMTVMSKYDLILIACAFRGFCVRSPDSAVQEPRIFGAAARPRFLAQVRVDLSTARAGSGTRALAWVGRFGRPRVDDGVGDDASHQESISGQKQFPEREGRRAPGNLDLFIDGLHRLDQGG